MRMPKMRDWESPSGAHSFIQWKGTSVCMDFHCDCGSTTHFDTDFAYFIRCPACKTVYEMSWHVEARKAHADQYDPKYVKEGQLDEEDLDP